MQEEYDRALAISLQQEEDNQLARLLQDNPSDNGSPSSQDYSVYSSEIHSDDSENTVNKKLEVKEVEKNLKRKKFLDEEELFESPNKRKFNKD